MRFSLQRVTVRHDDTWCNFMTWWKGIRLSNENFCQYQKLISESYKKSVMSKQISGSCETICCGMKYKISVQISTTISDYNWFTSRCICSCHINCPSYEICTELYEWRHPRLIKCVFQLLCHVFAFSINFNKYIASLSTYQSESNERWDSRRGRGWEPKVRVSIFTYYILYGMLCFLWSNI
jgi:hypothetical protein